jgi:hypothetical protein
VKDLTRAFAAGVMSCIVLLAGCTKATPQPAVPAIPDLSSDAPALSQLQNRLLSQDDLPEGFEETTLPTGQGGFGSLISCPSLEPPAAGADEARVSFAGVAVGNIIAESVRLTGPAQSHQVLADLARLPQQCNVTAPATALALGKESTALELNATLSGTGTVVKGYIAGLRDDQVLVLVVYVSPGTADRATFDSVTRVAWEKAASPAVTQPSPTIGS